MKQKLFIVALVALFGVRNSAGQSPEPVHPVVVDKTVATVNGELVTYSDLLWQLSLQPGTLLENPNSQALESALRLVTDQRLIMQQAEKLPTIAPSDAEIEVALAELIRQFPSEVSSNCECEV